MWVVWVLLSAFFLGYYDVLKKQALHHNPVLPVLFYSTVFGALFCVPVLVLSRLFPDCAGQVWFVPRVDLTTHGYLFLKSVLVASSWILSYYAMKYLPITVETSVKSTGPVWTVLGAVLFMGERLNLWQWAGMAVSLVFFWLFSQASGSEGISFKKNRWVLCLMGGTLLGALSGLYDKFLTQRFDHMAILVYYSIYLVPVLLPFLMGLWYFASGRRPFMFRGSIVFIGIALVLSDFLYFYALSDSNALISVVTALRRASVLVPFAAGVLLFKDKNLWIKGWLLLGMMVGVVVLMVGS
jgi:transporter family protein